MQGQITLVWFTIKKNVFDLKKKFLAKLMIPTPLHQALCGSLASLGSVLYVL